MTSKATRRVGIGHLVMIGAVLVAGLLIAWDGAKAATPQTLNYACQDARGNLYVNNNLASCPAGQTLVDFGFGTAPVAACALNRIGLLRVVDDVAECALYENAVFLHGPSETLVCAYAANQRTFANRLRLAGPGGTCNSSETLWRIAPGNPVAADDSYATAIDTTLTVPAPGVLANDMTAGGTISSFDATSAEGGSVSLNADGSFSYTPPSGFTGDDTFTYTLSSAGGSDSATVTIAVSDLPVAVDDEFFLAPNFRGTVPAPGVLANDVLNGATITAWDSTSAQGGTVRLNPDGSFAYTAPTGFSGDDTFTYTIANAVGSSTATVTLVLNAPPDAVDDAFTTDEDSAVSGNVLTNDSDPDNDPITVVEVNGASANVGVQITLASGALLTVNADGSFIWDPNGVYNDLAVNETATDSFTYTIADPLDTRDTATVTITITGLNDLPDAVDDSASTDEDTPIAIDVLANDTDPDASDLLSVQSFTVTSGSVVQNPDGTLQYDPTTAFNDLAAGETGTDTISYTVTDGNGGTDTATVTVTVTGVNDAPTADDQTLTTDEDVPLSITLTGTDPDTGTTLTFNVETQPGNGTLSGTAPNLTYTPDPNYNGPDSFTFSVDDGNGGTDTGTIGITVDPVNDPPTDIILSNSSVDENDPGAVVGTISVADPDTGDTHSLSLSGADAAMFEIVGTTLKLLDGVAADFEANSTLEITITATDSALATLTEPFTITVNNVNEAPTDITISNSSVDENSAGAIVGTLSAVDPDTGDSHTFTVDDVRFEVIGQTLKLTSGASLDHEAEPTVTLNITATDSGGLNTAKQFVITVTDVNEAPTDIALTGNEVEENADGATIGTLTVADPDTGDTHSFAVDDPRFEVVAGALKLKAGQSLDFEAEPSVTLAITATDAGGLFITESFTITVINVNEAPTATADAYGDVIGNVQATVSANCVLDNDTDPENDTLEAVAETITTAGGGTVVMAANGCFTYNPPVGASNTTDTFTYTVRETSTVDNFTATGTVTMTIINELVWFIDEDATAAGDGRFTSPFATLAAYNSSPVDDDPGDTIFVYSSATVYTGGISLKDNQDLFGEPHGLVISAQTLVPAGGTNPTIDNPAGSAVTLASNNTVRALNLTGNGGMTGSSVGTFTASNISITAAGLPGLSLSNGTVSATFTQVSANGGTTGINLSSLSGSVTINGGTVQNMSGNGITLSNSSNVTLAGMTVQSNGGNGILGASVDGLTIQNGQILNNDTDHPTGANDAGIRLDNALGTTTISGTTVSGTNGDNLRFEQASGTATISITGGTIGPNPVGTGANGIAAVATGSSNLTVNVSSATITGNQTAGVLTSAANSAVMTLNMTGNTVSDNNIGIDIGIGGDQTNFTLTGNTLTGHFSNAINIITDAGAPSTTNGVGTIQDNNIGSVVANSGSENSFGIAIDLLGSADAVIEIARNTIQETLFEGIWIGGSFGDGRADLTITNNNVAAPNDTSAAYPGIYVEAWDFRTTCANVIGNVSTGGTDPFGTAAGIFLSQADSAVFQLQGFGGDGTNPAVVEAFVEGNNPGTSTTVDTFSLVNYTGGTCATP